jgi:cell shape-determining protein MreC
VNHDLNASSIVIDQGTADGLTAGDPVIAPLVPYSSVDGTNYFGALVGVTEECGTNNCPVNLITNTSSPVGYTVKVLGGSGGAQGTLKPAPGTNDIFNISLIPVSAKVPVGGVVVTTSINSPRLPSRIPPGIPVGQVLDVSQTDASGPSKDVTVKPFADFQSLGDVLVMKVPNS